MMKDSKIFILCGRSSSGKDYYLKKLLSEFPQLHKVVTYTTRPARVDEVNEVDYYFVSDEYMKTMIENKDMLEYITYNTIYGDWTYGTHIGSFHNDTKPYICILDYEGYKKVKAMYPDRTVGLMIYLDTDTRKKNYIKRGGDEDEFNRRELADDVKFKQAERDSSLCHVINHIGSDDTIKLLRTLVKYELGEISE